MNSRLVSVLLVSVLFIAAGCSKEDKGGAVGKADEEQDPSSAVQEDGKTDDEEEQDAEETGVELFRNLKMLVIWKLSLPVTLYWMANS